MNEVLEIQGKEICDIKYITDRYTSSVTRNVTPHNKDIRGILFRCTDTSEYKMYHEQDCCEDVSVEEIIGDLSDLIGSELVVAEERTKSISNDGNGNSETWTFYEFRTVKGSVTIRWYGTSNGYYSEAVQFKEQERGANVGASHEREIIDIYHIYETCGDYSVKGDMRIVNGGELSIDILTISNADVEELGFCATEIDDLIFVLEKAKAQLKKIGI